MSRAILLLLAIFAMFSIASAGRTCPPNEVWTDCGTACPPTCAQPDPRPCTLQCVQGCQCRNGLLRNKWGKCVPKSACC
ncbi:chymotrypsin inhibitor-like [Nomia melanderi]|uniref:chymotrypsin inhibitor-like n=1 Tax=Nomia melanderi TaxID=2448451 RepID=UPI0013046DAD|nr:chymotrypsin inhibitor-like [Nomia melanderi]